MPTWAAVVASSVAFGLAHLSARDLPVLSALGLLLGWSYVRSRNLLTPIVIHGAWNSAVLTLLFMLAAQGVDVQELITVGAGRSRLHARPATLSRVPPTVIPRRIPCTPAFSFIPLWISVRLDA
jgi:hypothetical protein